MPSRRSRDPTPVRRNDCPKCEAPVGSPCRTRGGKTATTYHTPHFTPVPALSEDLDARVPEGPGRLRPVRAPSSSVRPLSRCSRSPTRPWPR
ncbi:zinc finger domain-containing protein [Streptomyces anandii]